MSPNSPLTVRSVFFSVDSIERLRVKCSTLEQDIRDPARLKDFYQFTFNYAKNPGQKCLGKEGRKKSNNGIF